MATTLLRVLYILWILSLPGTFCEIFDEQLGLNITFEPDDVDQLSEDDIVVVNMNYSLLTGQPVKLLVRSTDANIAVVNSGDELILLPIDTSHTEFNTSFQVKGVFLGRTTIVFSIVQNTTILSKNTTPSDVNSGIGDNSESGLRETVRVLSGSYRVTVIREDGPLNTAFLASVITLVVLANTAMGCKVELNTVKEILKKPLGPVVGLLSQFIIMPLLGLAASYAFQFEPGIALGLFATGCAPGGGASNAYTYLLGGDVSLSVTMTLISTLASFALIPLWLLTVGTQVIYKNDDVKIPYTNILTALAGLILPVLLGMLIKWKRPRWVKYILKAVTPLMIITLIVILSVGIYANLYIFKLLQPEVLAAGAILPNCGFILGGLAALVFRQPWSRVKTIAVETGLQNTGIPIVLLQVSLPKPDSDFAIVAPIASALFTPILLWIWILVRFIKKKCFKTSVSKNINTWDDMNLNEDSPDSPTESPPSSPQKL